MEFIVTGASGGVGTYLVSTLLRDKKTVFGTYYSTEPDSTIAERCSRVDVSDSQAVETWIASLPLNNIVLVNCAAVNYNKFFHKSDSDAWKRTVEINLFGTYNVIRAVLPVMRESRFGRIVNLTSVVTKLPTPGVSAYATSKAALNGLAKTVAVENASRGITINNLSLGYLDAGMTLNDVPGDFRSRVKERIPMERFGELNDVYRAIIAIVELPYMTGSEISINGGLV